MKIRTATTEELQRSLQRLFTITGVTSTQTIVALETLFARPVDPRPSPHQPGDRTQR